MRIVRRALRALARADRVPTQYAVTDVRRASRRYGVRGRDVVFLQQQLFGLPIYGSRRSVIMDSRRARITGSRFTLRAPIRLTPLISAEVAARTAIEIVIGQQKVGDSRLISVSSSPERTSVVAIEGLESPVTAYLTLFGRTASRLAWALTFSLPGGDGFKVVIDATSQKLLRRRQTTHYAAACLAIASGAGGPEIAQPEMQVRFEASWVDPINRRFLCEDADGMALKLPGPNAAGNYCNAVGQPFEQTTLNCFAVANAGFDLIKSFGGALQGRVKLTLLESASVEISEIALALPHLVNPLLSFMARDPGFRHTASDPSVVLHELGHLVLAAGVGGGQVANPFGTAGESAAVNEGLADFLGLTLWNAIRRTSAVGATDVVAFGSWALGPFGRDYAPFLSPGASVPTFPGTGSAHNKGRALCTALLRARRAIELETDAALADAIILTTLCSSLDQMPHEGDLPKFCCVSEAMLNAVPMAHRAKLESALSDGQIPNHCPHII